MIRVHIEPYTDFGRTLRIAVVDSDPETRQDFLLLADNEDYGFKKMPLQEGAVVPSAGYFLQVNTAQGQELLAAFVKEFARLGYITNNPHGTCLAENNEHLKTLKQENDRHFSLLEKTTDALIRSHLTER